MLSLIDRHRQLHDSTFQSKLTSTQSNMDRLSESLSAKAMDPTMFAGILAGNLSYHFVKWGAISAATKLLGSSGVLVESLSTSMGFMSEVLVFESSQRVLQVKFAGADASLLKWEGEHGLRKGLVNAALSLGSLKLAGVATAQQNLILQHAVSDTAMVFSHHAAAWAGWEQAPQGSLSEQYVSAEATLLQMQGGMALLHAAVPGLSFVGKNLELEAKSKLSKRFLSPFETRAKLLLAGSDPSAAVESDARDSVKPGDIIGGRYRVEALLGEGAMGSVYRVVHTTLDKPFAMKVLKPNLAKDSGAVERFKTEALAATRIGNPHIININDFGTLSDGSPYCVMEFLKGRSLAHELYYEGALPYPRILRIAAQLANALKDAHSKGIIHRDLKPDNIFLVDQGSAGNDFAKVLDFGIAKILDFGKAQITGVARNLTQANTIVGTPQYMPPEQIFGQPVDYRTDIYAFGIILYEMVTGKVPFDGDMGDIFSKQVHVMPPSFKEAGFEQFPPEFEAIVFKCLAKNPAERFQSMEALEAEFLKMRERLSPVPPSSLSVERTPSPVFSVAPSASGIPTSVPGMRSRWPLAVAGTAGIAGIFLGAFLIPGRKKEEVPVLPSSSASAPSVAPIVSASPVLTPIETPRREVTVSVRPTDAHIFKGSQDLGTGSVKLNLKSDEKVTLRFSKPGFIPQTMEVEGSIEAANVELKKISSASGSRPPKPAVSAPKASGSSPRPSEIADPWKKKKSE